MSEVDDCRLAAVGKRLQLPGLDVAGKSILLVDDVTYSGWTLTAGAVVQVLEAERDELLEARAELDTDRRRANAETLLNAVLVRAAERHPGNRFDAGRLEFVCKR